MSLDVDISRLIYRTDDNSYQFQLPHENNQVHNNLTQKHGIKRFQIITPSEFQGKFGYCLTEKVCAWLWRNQEDLTYEMLQEGLDLNIDRNIPAIGGRWSVKVDNQKSWWSSIAYYIPLLKTVESHEEVKLVVTQNQASSSYLSAFSSPPKNAISDNEFRDICISPRKIDTQGPAIQRIYSKPFEDAFTNLSTECLQKLEPVWVHGVENKGKYRLIALDNSISIEELHENNIGYTEEEFKQGNRRTVSMFKEYLIREFGIRVVDYFQYAYQISFDSMIKAGSPLLPDHVFKSNIGVLNVEMQDIDFLYKKLKDLKMELSSSKKMPYEPITNLFKNESKIGSSDDQFSIRELRGLIRGVQAHLNIETVPTLEETEKYLIQLLENEPDTASSLSVEAFNAINAMIRPTHDEIKKAFTGREIIDRAIMGFHTMGDKDIADPCRDMFEWLHTYKEIQSTESLKVCIERYAHILAKKSPYRIRLAPKPSDAVPSDNSPSSSSSSAPEIGELISCDVSSANNETPKVLWYTGLLVPGPKKKDGTEIWYRVDAFIDDNEGNVNYVLLPACDNYLDDNNQPYPMIKLYRSTASNKNALSWYDSIQADLNPDSPGSLNPEAAYEYEKLYFDERTIPVWVGYLISAQRHKSALKQAESSNLDHVLLETIKTKYQKDYKLALDYYIEQLQLNASKHPEKGEKSQALLKELSETPSSGAFDSKNYESVFDRIDEYLYKEADETKELPIYKNNQGILFAGHSLGGALAQHGMYYFGARRKRIPCPGFNFTCYTSHAPAIAGYKNAEYMAFGRTHRALFKHLQISCIHEFQFEKDDIIPKAGEDHLGANYYKTVKDHSWLQQNIFVFSPLPTATSLDITTAPVHGRKTGLAKPNDVKIVSLSPKQLAEFDGSYFPSSFVNNAFGCGILRSKQLIEFTRRNSGTFLIPILKLVELFYTNKAANKARDNKGVLSRSFLHRSTQPSSAI